MIEMQKENKRVDNLRLLQVGKEWTQAITDGALDRLEPLCQPQVISKLLTPSRYENFDTATDLVAKFFQWFGECSDFQLEHSRIEMLGERLAISYEILLQEQGRYYKVEQQLYCTMQGERIAFLHLLCSGFQSVILNSDQ